MKPRLAHRWTLSASAYAGLSLQLQTYRWSNRFLVERMHLEPGMEIVDLGCGTGATSLAAFRQQPRLLHIWAVDGVAEMLARARDLLQGLSMTFVHKPAETFSRSMPGRPMQRVLCNSAFFQFADPSKVLGEIRKVLDAKGLFGLTVPGPAGDEHLKTIVAEVAALAERRDRAALTIGREAISPNELPPPGRATRPTCDYKTVRDVLKKGGFEVVSSEFISFEPTHEEIIPWLLLPVFRPPEWRSLTDQEAASALEEAFERNPGASRISWNTVVARPVLDDAGPIRRNGD